MSTLFEVNKIRCLSIGYEDRSILLPDVLIQEIFSSNVSLASFEHEAVLGILNWRSALIPIVDLSFFLNESSSHSSGNALIIVKACFSGDSLGFYGITSENIPQLIQVHKNEESLYSGFSENINFSKIIFDREYLIPNLKIIESTLVKLQCF